MPPHTSPYTARAIGLTEADDADVVTFDAREAADAARVDDAQKPQPETKEPHWQFYLPTKFDEGSSEAVQFPAFGWQNLVRRVAQKLGMEEREIKGKEKHGSDRVVCAIMQPYHLFREYYLARMNNKNCWTTKFFGVADMCEKLRMASWFKNLVPLLGPDCGLLHIAPKTFVLPQDREQLRDFMHSTAGHDTGIADPRRTMIVKPVGGSQGKGIFITQSFEDLEGEADHAAVVQEYIARPLLLGGLKFDLRVYVIIVGLGAQQSAFIVEEGLARFCTKEYTEPSGTICESDWARDALRAHLTNTAVNKGSDDYDVDASKRTMGMVLQQLCDASAKGLLSFTFTEETFWRQLDNIVSSWLALMNPVLGLTFRQASKAARSAALSRRKKSSGIRQFMAAQRAAAVATGGADLDTAPKETAGAENHENERETTRATEKGVGAAADRLYTEYQDYLSKCRSGQVLGFDVMLDASGQMHLLEVNNSPSLSTEEVLRFRSPDAQVNPADGAAATEQPTQLQVDQPDHRCICTDAGCEYTEGENLPHIHREGSLDRRIKFPVVEALLQLVTSHHDALAYKGDLQVRPLRSNKSFSEVQTSLQLLERAYLTHFLDTDDVGPKGWPSSCLLSFSQPMKFYLPPSFRSALLSLSAAGEAKDVVAESCSLDAMITEWDEHMKQQFVANERRSSSARFELGDFVSFLDRALRQGKLRDGLDLPRVLGALSTPDSA